MAGIAGLGMAWWGAVRQGLAGVVRHGVVKKGRVWHGRVWHGRFGKKHSDLKDNKDGNDQN